MLSTTAKNLSNTTFSNIPDGKRLSVNKNLTPYNNKMAYHCRELKRASLINSSYSADGIFHIRQTMN